MAKISKTTLMIDAPETPQQIVEDPGTPSTSAGVVPSDDAYERVIRMMSRAIVGGRIERVSIVPAGALAELVNQFRPVRLRLDAEGSN